MKSVLIMVFFVSSIFSMSVQAEEDSYPRFEETLKGFMTYRQYETFESVNATNAYTKKSLDLNVLEFKGEYGLSSSSELEFEIEFEHGGTGSTLEFEPLEEFGEFETETEKGGEVILSELYYLKKLDDSTSLKIGKIPIPVSLNNIQTSYMVFPSIFASSAEGSMIPLEWRELGIQAQKRFDTNLKVKALVTSGLNSEFFETFNWIGGGYQKKFETVNAGNLAGIFVLEYGDVATSNGIGVSLYYGETAGNRFKLRKLNSPATVTLASIFGNWTFIEDLTIRAQALRGRLSNSDEVTLANATLTGAATPDFKELGHEAQLETGEISYRFLHSDDASLRGFVGYEHVNTMAVVEGAIAKNDRFNQLFSSVGLMQVWEKIFFVKAQYTKHSSAALAIPATDDYQLAFGFDWYGYNL